MASTAKLNFLPAEIHLLPAKEDHFLNILAQLEQLFSLTFKNAVHDAFNFCYYWHRLSHWLTPSPSSFFDLGYWFWCWLRLLLCTALSSGHFWEASKQPRLLRAGKLSLAAVSIDRQMAGHSA